MTAHAARASDLKATETRPGPAPPSSSLIREVSAAATRWHASQRRSDGSAFIEHPRHVARLLQQAGCSEALVAAGLLHDILEATAVTVQQLEARFGSTVAQYVAAVSDDRRIVSFRLRKRALRAQVEAAGGDVALLFAADKLAKMHELTRMAARDPQRFGAQSRDGDLLARLDHYQRSALLLARIASGHPHVRALTAQVDAHRRASLTVQPPPTTPPRRSGC